MQLAQLTDTRRLVFPHHFDVRSLRFVPSLSDFYARGQSYASYDNNYRYAARTASCHAMDVPQHWPAA